MSENEFDYKEYSLKKLEGWVHNAISCSDATPQEIYDTIRKIVDEEYHSYKHRTGRCYELLALLNGNGNFKLSEVLAEREYYEGKEDSNKFVSCDKDDSSSECQKALNDFWEEHYYPEEAKDNGMRPWGHSDMEYLVANSNQYRTYTIDELKSIWGTDNSQYTEEELNAMCDKAESDEKAKSHNCPPTELTYEDAIAAGWTMTDDGFWFPPQKEDKVVKWQLPVEVDGLSGECYTYLPDDLLEAANLKEGDEVEWVDMGDFFILKKIIK